MRLNNSNVYSVFVIAELFELSDRFKKSTVSLEDNVMKEATDDTQYPHVLMLFLRLKCGILLNLIFLTLRQPQGISAHDFPYCDSNISSGQPVASLLFLSLLS